jgi:branched-chain amino acid transport system ATP-binding protein
MSEESPILAVDDVSLSYGGTRALGNVTLSVRSGEVLAILGANGAGKSSLGRAVCGLVKPFRGTIRFDGKDITHLPPHKVARLGLTYIPEGRGIFPSMSVDENLKMWTRCSLDGRPKEEVLSEIVEMFPVLSRRSDQRAGTLSGGEQQMLALARGFCNGSKLLVVDEVSLGLAPVIVDQVFEGLALAKAQGKTILVIEQFVERALALADSCAILQRGAVAWSGKAENAGAEVQAKYFGESSIEVSALGSN